MQIKHAKKVYTTHCSCFMEETANIKKIAPNQRPLQNGHFGSKIKNARKHAKNVSTRHCGYSMQKTAKKKLIFEK